MLVTGRVQQVGFRAFVQRRARELGLVGFVRNDPDGSVEVVARGAADLVARLEELLRRGPPLAVVSGIESTAAPERDYQRFEVIA